MNGMNKEEKWTLQIVLQKAPEQIVDGTKLLYIAENGTDCVCLIKDGNKFCVQVFTDAAKEPLILEAEAEVKELKIVFCSYRVELWADEVLRDEEWPDGVCLTKECEAICCMEELVKATWQSGAVIKEPEYAKIEDISYWAPELGRHNVGDCMPFADGDTYHLFYLKDRHQHKSKWGKGAHQFAHISTKDMVHWQEHPVAVEITNQWEGSICTGSVLKAGDLYYAFYAVRMTDGSSAKISYATSKDCIHFTKSEEYFTLTAPYETTSVRDPEVFYGADGLYHMLLTTNWEAEAVTERNGCLAHLISSDLKCWEQKEPFLVPGYTDQPECTDYFDWNGWYYLIFSNYGTAKYRYARKPFGPWICPEQEMIDGLLYRVPKTATFCGRRIAAGFLCINTEGESYAGSLVLREVIQHEDGTLGTSFVKELVETAKGPLEHVLLKSGESGGYRQAALKSNGEYIKIEMKTEEKTGSYGIILGEGSDKSYQIRFDPILGSMRVSKAHGCLYHDPSKRLLHGVEGLTKGCTLEVVCKKDILDICINGRHTFVCRMEKEWPDTMKWGCFVKDGAVQFKTRNN